MGGFLCVGNLLRWVFLYVKFLHRAKDRVSANVDNSDLYRRSVITCVACGVLMWIRSRWNSIYVSEWQLSTHEVASV